MDRKLKISDSITTSIWFCLIIVMFSSTPLLSESGLSTNDKIFSKKQAKTGQKLYEQNCLICHDKKYFRPVFKSWEGQSLGTLFLVMSSSMPQGNPGSLPDKEYIDILAYMMSQNRYSTGEKELPTDVDKLNSITIKSRKK
mgnify:FL=1